MSDKFTGTSNCCLHGNNSGKYEAVLGKCIYYEHFRVVRQRRQQHKQASHTVALTMRRRSEDVQGL